MLVHMWNSQLNDTLCGAGTSNSSVTVDREAATCVQCLDILEGIETKERDEQIAGIKETAAVLKVKLDRLEPAGDTLMLLLSQIEGI